MKKKTRLLTIIMVLLLLVGCSSNNKKTISEEENIIEKEDVSEESEEIEETKLILHDGVGYYVEDGKIYFAMAAETQDKYICNSPYNEANSMEYHWSLFFTDGTHVYEIGTSWFKFVSDKYPENIELSINEMQTALYKKGNDEPSLTGAPFSLVGSAKVSAKNGLLLWEVELPEEPKIQADNITIFDYDTNGTSSIFDILKEADNYVQSGDLLMAYDYLRNCCNETNYPAIIAKENEILQKLFERNISLEILDDNKMSFTLEIESNVDGFILNETKYGWPEGAVDFEVSVYFDDYNGENINNYAIASYHLIDTKEGSEINASFRDIKNHNLLKFSSQESAWEITKDWDIVAKANAKLSGNKITWTFDIPEGFNPYNISISKIEDCGNSYYWQD